MTGEHGVMGLMVLLGGIVWKDLQRRIVALEADKKDNSALAVAVAQLVIEVKHLKEQIDRLIVTKESGV